MEKIVILYENFDNEESGSVTLKIDSSYVCDILDIAEKSNLDIAIINSIETK